MAYHLGLLFDAHAALTASLSRLKAQHIGTEALSLSELEANRSITGQDKGQGGVEGHRANNIRQNLLIQQSTFVSRCHSTPDMATAVLLAKNKCTTMYPLDM